MGKITCRQRFRGYLKRGQVSLICSVVCGKSVLVAGVQSSRATFLDYLSLGVFKTRGISFEGAIFEVRCDKVVEIFGTHVS